jgi:hypothetical protein
VRGGGHELALQPLLGGEAQPPGTSGPRPEARGHPQMGWLSLNWLLGPPCPIPVTRLRWELVKTTRDQDPTQVGYSPPPRIKKH